jgi:hypothetical protein
MPRTMAKPNRTGSPINVWVDDRIQDQLRVYLDRTKPRVSKTAAVEEALIRFLTAEGLWPPPDPPAEPEEEADP